MATYRANIEIEYVTVGPRTALASVERAVQHLQWAGLHVVSYSVPQDTSVDRQPAEEHR